MKLLQIVALVGWLGAACAKEGFVGFNRRVVLEEVRKHNLGASSLVPVSDDELLVNNFMYDGKGPAAYFCAGVGPVPTTAQCLDAKNIMHIKGQAPPGQLARGIEYTGEQSFALEWDVPGQRLQDRDWISVYCVEYHNNFGHAYLNRLAKQAAAHPPRQGRELRQLVAKPPADEQREENVPDDDDDDAAAEDEHEDKKPRINIYLMVPRSRDVSQAVTYFNVGEPRKLPGFSYASIAPPTQLPHLNQHQIHALVRPRPARVPVHYRRALLPPLADGQARVVGYFHRPPPPRKRPSAPGPASQQLGPNIGRVPHAANSLPVHYDEHENGIELLSEHVMHEEN